MLHRLNISPSAISRMGLFFFILFIFLLSSCSNEPDETKSVKVCAPQDLKKEINGLVISYMQKDTSLTIDSVYLMCYRYFKPHYADHLLWFNESKLSSRGENLLNLIEGSVYYGLNPKHYHLKKILSNIDSIHSNKDLINVTSLVKADLLLSDAYFLMGAHLNKGRFYADSLLLQTNFHKLTKSWDSLLFAGYNKGNLKAALDSLEPKFYHYRMLKKELAIILNDPKLFQIDSILFD